MLWFTFGTQNLERKVTPKVLGSHWTDNSLFLALLMGLLSRYSEMFAFGSQDGKTKVWRTSNGQCLLRLENAHFQAITSVALSPDGSQLLSTSYDGTASCYLFLFKKDFSYPLCCTSVAFHHKLHGIEMFQR
ncbi:hypothetical protein L6452_20097 [Arctium lappa]|uniref:Uncharacterized protein n=1 Tax=Arctium lappa TaxID=4217 RepID=A0ACB9BAY7_ARCLA|nr:hypothetical protein L6452_20097 [Arctium lappa]